MSLCSSCTCTKRASFVGNFPHISYISLLLHICNNGQGSIYSSQTSSHILDTSKHLAQHRSTHEHCRLSHLPHLSHSSYIWDMLFVFYMPESVPSCRVTVGKVFPVYFACLLMCGCPLPRKSNMQLSYLL